MSVKLVAPFDWKETKDYAIDWTPEMDRTSDTLATVNFDLITTSTGLAIASADIDATGKFARVWLTASDPTQLEALAGETVLIDHTVTTTGGRTLNQTVKLSIKDK